MILNQYEILHQNQQEKKWGVQNCNMSEMGQGEGGAFIKEVMFSNFYHTKPLGR